MAGEWTCDDQHCLHMSNTTIQFDCKSVCIWLENQLSMLVVLLPDQWLAWAAAAACDVTKCSSVKLRSFSLPLIMQGMNEKNRCEWIMAENLVTNPQLQTKTTGQMPHANKVVQKTWCCNSGLALVYGPSCLHLVMSNDIWLTSYKLQNIEFIVLLIACIWLCNIH